MHRKKKAYILVFILVLVYLYFVGISPRYESITIPFYTKAIVEHQDIIHRALKELSRAHRQSRSISTRRSISNAFLLLKSLPINPNSDVDVLPTPSQHSEKLPTFDVCPEKWVGDYDHPLYNVGFKTLTCDHPSIDSLMTLLFIINDCKVISPLINGIRGRYHSMPVIMGILVGLTCDSLINGKSNLVSIPNMKDDSASWHTLVSKVNTKYVLIGRNMINFDNNTDIERLVRMINMTTSNVIGGSQRLEDGRWFDSCHQMAIRNYTLKLDTGYDLSTNSCMYCDFLSGPFATTKQFLLDHWSKPVTNGALSMLDFFMLLFQKEIGYPLSCPDVMFHVSLADTFSTLDRKFWIPLVIKYELNRIVLPGGKDFMYSCDESQVKCYKSKGIILPICCVHELNEAILFLFKICDEYKVRCEINSGSQLGIVKMRGTFPWERDADMIFQMDNLTALESALPKFKEKGYRMVKSYVTPDKTNLKNCRLHGYHGCVYYAYHTPNWRIEMWGCSYMIGDLRGNLTNPTSIQFIGTWLPTSVNPALASRNQYSDDIFKHIEHWMTLGYSTSHSRYTDITQGTFKECPRPGFHGCLDNYLPEGNKQFGDPLL